MDSFRKASFKTSRQLSYTYYHHPGDDTAKPTILLHHGWPDSAHLYQHVVPHLIPLGFPILIPDLLGYGGTSKPLDVKLYDSKSMATDIIEILDHEKIPSVISVGHDWGSFMAQRIYLWYPSRVRGLILLNVAYLPPSQEPFELQNVLEQQEKATGHPRYAYWEFFTAPDANEVVQNHLESFWCLLHGADDDWMQKMFCVRGAMRKFLENDERVPLKPYAQDEAVKETFLNRVKQDGLEASFNWYKVFAQNHTFDVEKNIDFSVLRVNKPVLFVGCDGDAVCLSAYIHMSLKAGLLPDCTVKELHCAHWSPLEKPDEVGSIMADWLKAKSFA